MSPAQAKIFIITRRFSSIALASVAILSVILENEMDSSDITWQVVVALLALAIGIPHGALDHLVTIPRTSIVRMSAFIAAYVAIALAAVWAILSWNVTGFICVVVMSVLHFGVGDAAFINELDRTSRSNRAPRFAQVFYALAAGTLPVIIPLTNERSSRALGAVNSELMNWHRGFDSELMTLTLSLTVVAVAVLAWARRWREIVDLAILALLALVAPPLVAFAAYFGLWHAMRHTARLTLNLPASQRAVLANQPARAFWSAVLPGIPALIGTFAVAALLGIGTSSNLSDEYLWLSLVVVWALTVPHMLVTARLDRAALSS